MNIHNVCIQMLYNFTLFILVYHIHVICQVEITDIFKMAILMTDQ